MIYRPLSHRTSLVETLMSACGLSILLRNVFHDYKVVNGLEALDIMIVISFRLKFTCPDLSIVGMQDGLLGLQTQ